MASKERVVGAGALLKRIATIQSGIGPLVSRERLGAFLVRRMQERFDKEQAPDGTRWKGRAPTSRGNHKILNKTGALRGALGVLEGTGSGFGAATGAGFRIGIRSMKVRDGSRMVDTAVYGRAHHLGLGHVPQRRILGIGALDVKAVDSLLRRELKKLTG